MPRRWEDVPGTQHQILVDPGVGQARDRGDADAKPSRKELVARAAELGIKVPSKATIPQIEDAIAEAEAEAKDDDAASDE